MTGWCLEEVEKVRNLYDTMTGIKILSRIFDFSGIALAEHDLLVPAACHLKYEVSFITGYNTQ